MGILLGGLYVIYAVSQASWMIIGLSEKDHYFNASLALAWLILFLLAPLVTMVVLVGAFYQLWEHRV